MKYNCRCFASTFFCAAMIMLALLWPTVRATAETPLQDGLTVKYLILKPSWPINQPLQVVVLIQNPSPHPVSFYLYAHDKPKNGDIVTDNPRFSCSASLDGVAVEPNLHPPTVESTGDTLHRFELGTNQGMGWFEEVRNWVQLKKPGAYQMHANLTVELVNPPKDGVALINHPGQFSMQVAP